MSSFGNSSTSTSLLSIFISCGFPCTKYLLRSLIGISSSISCFFPSFVIIFFIIALPLGTPSLIISSNGPSSIISSFLPSLVIIFFLITLVSGFCSSTFSSTNSIGTSSSISCSFPSFNIIIFLNTLALGSFPYFIDFTTNSSPGTSSSVS